MAQPTGTVSRYSLDDNGDVVRDDLSDMIYNIAPTETPVTTAIGREKSYSDYKEWIIDSLAAANKDNARIDGDDFSGDTLTAGNRIGNYHQIARKDLVISRRADIVRKAGRATELAYQIAKAGKELKRDVEASILSNNVAGPGNATLASTTAGLAAWIGAFDDTSLYEIDTGYVSRGAGLGADGSMTGTSDASGYVDTASTGGTVRALTEDGMLGVIKACYVNGATPSMIVCGPSVKQLFSKYMFGTSARVATPFQDHGTKPRAGATVLGATDYYVSDFGTLEVVPDRFCRTVSSDQVDLFVIDPEYLAISYLTPFSTEEIAKSGDSEKRMLLVDYSLIVKNPVAHGTFTDIDDDTPMVAS